MENVNIQEKQPSFILASHRNWGEWWGMRAFGNFSTFLSICWFLLKELASSKLLYTSWDNLTINANLGKNLWKCLWLANRWLFFYHRCEVLWIIRCIVECFDALWSALMHCGADFSPWPTVKTLSENIVECSDALSVSLTNRGYCMLWSVLWSVLCWARPRLDQIIHLALTHHIF